MSNTPNLKDVVRIGYDAISHLYRSDSSPPPEHYKTWIAELLPLLPSPPSRILDLGCGCGDPVSRDLSHAGYDITGVDFSSVQIDRARKLIPTGTFIQAEVTSLHLDSKFSAVIALYVIIHVPIEEQAALIHRIGAWTEEGGYCLMTVGINAWTGEEYGWRGSDEFIKMWWSQASLEDYRTWVMEAGFEILKDEHVPENGNEGHQYLFLKKVRSDMEEDVLT
jgi:cyclopropane fatty-acyl-phospholipid synthase-like methyltransferase